MDNDKLLVGFGLKPGYLDCLNHRLKPWQIMKTSYWIAVVDEADYGME